MAHRRFVRLFAGVFAAGVVLVAAEPVLASASPTITTQATSAVVEQPIDDAVTLSGGASPTGSITWNLYKANTGCVVSTSLDRVSVPVGGDGVYTSPSFTPIYVGTYQWVATYSGDANNSSVSSSCTDTNGQSVVSKASPTLSTTASSNIVGQPIYDTATLSGGDSPHGSITWSLYKANTGCVKSVDPVSVPVDGDGTYTSPPVTPANAGTYQWVAEYSGDANNNSTASSCTDVNEQSVVSPASPSLSTTASSNIVGQPIDDVATLSGGYSPSGWIMWNLYAAGTGCVTPLHTASVPVNGDGVYTSPNSVLPAGSYEWVATYSGDTNNNPISSSCTDQNEQSVVSKLSPSISTTATSGALGQAIDDVATLSGGNSPTGSINWNLYVADTGCVTSLDAVSVPVSGDGTYTSPPLTPGSAGTYQWVATYSGDANNNSISSSCTDQNERSTVTPAPTSPATSGSPAAPGTTTAATTKQAVKAAKLLRCGRHKVKKHRKVHGKRVTVCVAKKRVFAAKKRRAPTPAFTG